jgi:hypothetical protein
MDALQRSHFLERLSGQTYLSQNAAFSALVVTADEVDRPLASDDLWMSRGLI